MAYGQITAFYYPLVANPGETVDIEFTLVNRASSAVSFAVSATAGGTRFMSIADNQATIWPNYPHSFSGSFVMGNSPLVVQVTIYYYGGDNNWHEDITYNASITTPDQANLSDYSLKSYILYPASASYEGACSTAIITFPPQIMIPGFEWLVDNILERFSSVCSSVGVTALAMQVYTKPGSLGSTHYAMQFVAHGSDITDTIWDSILGGIFPPLALYFSIIAVKHNVIWPFGGVKAVPVPGNSIIPNTGNTDKSYINGPTTSYVTDSGGNVVRTYQPGETMVVHPGETLHVGASGANELQAGGIGQWIELIKWGAIGVIAIVVATNFIPSIRRSL